MRIIAQAILSAAIIQLPATALSCPPVIESVEAEEAETPANANETAPAAGVTLSGSLRGGGVGALRKLWKDSGIESTLFSGEPDEATLVISESQVELDGSEGAELLLSITDSTATDYHFLALQEDVPSSAVIGWIDLRNQRSGQPVHRVERLGERTWLVIRALKGSGSGFSRVHEFWHAAASSLAQVLSYPVEGFVNGHDMPFNRSFTGSSPRLEEIGGAPRVSLDLSVRYTNGSQFAIDGLDELFTRTALVHYLLRAEDGAFVLDESSSGMNEAEIEGIFGDDAEGFLRHNFSQLKEIAQRGDGLRRQWLRRFLAGQDDSSEKSILEELLGEESIITTAGE